MPHDAALYATSVKQRRSPAETAAANEDAVDLARLEYENSADQTTETFAELASLVPQVASLSPTTLVAGALTFTLTVNGFDFDAGAKIRWAGTQQTTTRVSDKQLTCSITAAKVAAPGSFSVSVINGTGKISNSVAFTVTAAD